MPRHLSISALLDLLLPGSCLLCGATSTKTRLCTGCAADLPLLSAPVCPICAAPLAASAPACGNCLKAPPAFDATLARLRYAFPVDRLVQELKFAHRLATANFFAASMLAGERPTGDVVVPVPLAGTRLAERGFNQALEIARPLARTLDLPLATTSLVRVRTTLPQSRLPWHARQRNVRHAFECRADFSGASVIVVDDVMTTGATLDAVAQALKDCGAARVVNWVTARTVKGIATA